MPGGDVYRLGPAEMGGQEPAPAYGQAMAADVAARNPDLIGGRVGGRSYVFENPNNVTDTDSRQPARAGVLHPDVEAVLLRNRGSVSSIPGPETEVANYNAKRLFGPLGKEGSAVARTPQGPPGEMPRVGGASLVTRPR
jgi:hypothetical protein